MCVLFVFGFALAPFGFFHLVPSKITCYGIVVPTRCQSNSRENRYLGMDDMDVDIYIYIYSVYGMCVCVYVRTYVWMRGWMYVRR